MAHFAEIDKNGKVIKVVVVPNDVEDRGQDYLANELGLGGKWVQTSYNTFANQHTNGGVPVRGNFAGIGYTYDSILDVFIPPKIHPSWKLSYTTYQWEAPVAKPADVEGYLWTWYEINQEWIQIAIPTI
jgi:hypothetical protein